MQLRKIANISAGHPFRARIPESPGSGIMAVQMKDTSPHEGIRWNDCIQTELASRRDDYLQEGDILIAARGSRNYAVLVDDSLSSTGMQAVAAPQFFIVRVNSANVLPAYLCWFLNQPPCQRYFELNAEGSHTKALKRNALDDITVAIPALKKQQAIVQLANTLQMELRLLEQLRLNAEQMMGAISRQLVDEHLAANLPLNS